MRVHLCKSTERERADQRVLLRCALLTSRTDFNSLNGGGGGPNGCKRNEKRDESGSYINIFSDKGGKIHFIYHQVNCNYFNNNAVPSSTVDMSISSDS